MYRVWQELYAEGKSEGKFDMSTFVPGPAWTK